MGLLGNVIGGITGLIGFNQARQNAKGQRGAIARAYQMAQMQQGIDQANTREDTNESLNRRGVLAAGAAPRGPAVSPIGKSVAATGAYRDFYNNAQQGAVGASNTLGGQVNADLGDQFYREQKSLYDNTSQLTNQVNANETNSIIGSAVNGVQTAMNVNAGQNANGLTGALQGAFGMPVNMQPSPGVAAPSAPTGGGGSATGATGTPVGGGNTLSGDPTTANYNFHVG